MFKTFFFMETLLHFLIARKAINAFPRTWWLSFISSQVLVTMGIKHYT